MVGKVDIRKLDEFAQDDPDVYSYSGGLCKANQGIMEFVEMFKAPIKVLHPLLTATQEGNYNGTEAIGAIPFEGVVLAHSNESEWRNFRNNKSNEAFIDRVYIVKVPYCLRVSEEIKIYEKLLNGSSLNEAHCAPDTLRMLAQFSVLSRLREPENSSAYSKMRIYDGENLKDTDPKAKSIYALRHPESLTALVVSAPALRMAHQPRWKLALVSLASLIAPALGFSSGLDETGITRDPDLARERETDSLIHDRISPRLYRALERASGRVLQHAQELRLPTLVIQGQADRIVDPQGATLLADSAPGSNLKLLTYSGAYHEVFNDLDREQVFRDLLAWLDATLGRS